MSFQLGCLRECRGMGSERTTWQNGCRAANSGSAGVCGSGGVFGVCGPQPAVAGVEFAAGRAGRLAAGVCGVGYVKKNGGAYRLLGHRMRIRGTPLYLGSMSIAFTGAMLLAVLQCRWCLVVLLVGMFLAILALRRFCSGRSLSAGAAVSWSLGRMLSGFRGCCRG